MNKNKGFTLVELLAVIVILAIIALIATPIILNVISDAKKQAALESFKGYIDGAEKTIVLNEFEDEKDTTFPEADDNGCYNLNDLDKKINVKGTKPNIDSGAKVCFENGVVTNITGLSFNGYKVEYKSGKYLINGEEVEKDDKKDLIGIPSEEYTQGQTVSYLGYKWLVMKDNGDNTQLVMDGYLNESELKANLPSDVDRSEVSSLGTMSMCQEPSGNYCGYYGGTDKPYSWETSLIKPTLDKWLDNKMKDYSLDKTLELKGMSFSDVNGTINDYVRVPLYDEAKEMNGDCGAETGHAPYCPDESHYLYTGDTYWLIGATDHGNGAKAVLVSGSNKGAHPLHESSTAYVRPVITVNEN